MTLIADDLYLDTRDLVEVSRSPTEPDKWCLRFQRGDWSTVAVVSGKFKDELMRRLDEGESVTSPIPVMMGIPT